MSSTTNTEHLSTIWNDYISRKNIIKDPIPLFEIDDQLFVETKRIGRDDRYILKRSQAIDEKLRKAAHLVRVNPNKYEGILYMMYQIKNEQVIPRYIGKTETVGKTGRISSLLKGKSPKPRWDDYDQYHIGELSKAVCKGYEGVKIGKQYKLWADELFAKTKVLKPKLVSNLYLDLNPWRYDEVGLWKDYGATSLGLHESMLIDISRKIFSEKLLNIDGVTRKLSN